MVLNFSIELQVVEANCKDVENRLKEKQEGEPGIIVIKSFMHLANVHASYCCVLLLDFYEVYVGRNKALATVAHRGNTKIFLTVQKYFSQYKNISPNTKMFLPVQKYFSQFKNIFPIQ